MKAEHHPWEIIFGTALIALVAPLGLIVVESFLPYPAIIEEVVKAALVWCVLYIRSAKLQFQTVLLLGGLFAFSESMFYMASFLMTDTPLSFFQRIVVTMTLHTLTMLVILFFSQKKAILIFPATLLAVIIHAFFNSSLLK